MALFIIWGIVAAYFAVLWFAVGLELAVAGSVFFWFLATKLSLPIIADMLRDRASVRRVPPETGPTIPANLDQPPELGKLARPRQQTREPHQ